MNNEKLLINDLKSNNSEIMSNKQIEEMAKILQFDACIDVGTIHCRKMDDCNICKATRLYEAGYHKKSEWISVDERLPTEQKDFLVYYGFGRGDGDLGMMFTGVLTYFAYDKKPHFQHEETGLRVTHWMPLPDAPKMKGE